MSEQRKMRAELRQGLHQFLMQLYLSYTQSGDKRAAIDQIVEVLHEQHEYFTGTAMVTKSGAEEELAELAKQFEAKAKATSDYEEQMTYYHNVEALNLALDILVKERGSVNGKS
jgi:hypothetical protein